jgi:hypothetical protein
VKLKNDVPEVTSLYGGEVTLTFNPQSHRYTISENGNKPFQCPSVTTILNVLNKPALVEWGVKCACDFMYDGLQDLFQQECYSSDEVLDVLGNARQAHNRVKDEAAEIGTGAHDWLAQYWTAKLDLAPPPQPLEEGPVQNCITAVMGWIKEHEVKPILIEKPSYSRLHKITGTADFIGWIDGKLSVLDYKSTKQIWPEVALQTAPYAGMYQEEYRTAISNRYALRMDKTNGSFDSKVYPADTYELDMDTFLATFKIYDRLKHLRRKPKKDWIEQL